MDIAFRPMTIEDYSEVLALWREVEHMGLHDDADSREGIGRFLDRNPGMSFVAVARGRIVGAALGGHDGRRGSITHLAVAKDFRRRGVGRRIVDACVKAFREAGLHGCICMAYVENELGRTFWKDLEWREIPHVVLLVRHFEEESES